MAAGIPSGHRSALQALRFAVHSSDNNLGQRVVRITVATPQRTEADPA